MARWKLMTSHYLNVPNVEWEYNETGRNGEPIRRRFPVPKLLDVNDPRCWTNKWGNRDNEEGEIVVCHEGKGDRGDQIFIGDPTPDMMPLDDEAKAISAGFEEKWKYKPETAENGYSQSLIDRFQAQMEEAKAKTADAPGLDKLVGAIEKMAEQNAALLAHIASQNTPVPTVRKV